MPRRFPTPWTVHSNDSAFWVEDATGKRFAFTYHATDLTGPGKESYVYEDEARRIVTNIARLPELLEKSRVPIVGVAEANVFHEKK